MKYMENIRGFENERIAIVGGGNIGTQFACTCASKGYQVTVCSSKPEKYNGTIQMVDESGQVFCEGRGIKATSNIAEAMEGSSVVFVAVPAMLFESTAKKMLPYIQPGVKIGSIPGSGGAEFTFRECVKRGAVLFGLQRVPAVARLLEYGRRVQVEGKRDCLYLAAIPSAEASRLSTFIGDLFDMPCHALPNYLSVTMTPSNPILHTTRLRTMFSDYAPGKIYDRNPLFYGEWSDASSELLIACDEEHQSICRALDGLDLSGVRSLKLHYESNTVEEMTKKLTSIKSLHNLGSPMTKVDKGWVIDFNSRYFTADFPYGLAIIAEIGDIAGVPTPHIKETLAWYYEVSGNDAKFDISKYGIRTKEDIYEFYK